MTLTADDYYERAQTRSGKGDNKGAIADFTKAIKLNPRHGMAYVLRGEAYHASSQTDKAIADFTKAIKIGVPNRAIAYGNRGSEHLAKGDYSRALEDFNRAINELDPKLAVLHLGRRTVHLEKGNTKKAEWDLTCAMRLDDSLRYLIRSGLEGFNKAIEELDPKLAVMHLGRGTAYLEKGKTEKAKRDLTSAKILDVSLKSLVGPLYQRCIMSERENQFGRAIPNAELVKSDVPQPDADLSEIWEFALTFDGYAHNGSSDKCGTIANARRHRTLSDLRTCLFFEQRRHHHFGEDPEDEAMEYIYSLIEKIRQKVDKKKV